MQNMNYDLLDKDDLEELALDGGLDEIKDEYEDEEEKKDKTPIIEDEILGYPTLLSDSETLEFFERFKNGDKEAKNILIERNLGLVKSIAFSFPDNPVLSKADLIQEGSIGLMKAVDKFKPEKGFKFSTYATWWIKQAIQRSFSNNSKTIRIPVHVQENIFRIKKAQKYLTQTLGQDATINEIYEYLSIDCSCYNDIVNHEFFGVMLEVSDDIEQLQEIENIILEDLAFDENYETVIKAIVVLAKKNENIPTIEEVEKRVNLSPEEIEKFLDYEVKSTASSLDIKANDDMNDSIGVNISSGVNIENMVGNKMIAEGLIKALDEVYGTGKHSKEYYIQKHSEPGSKNYDPTGENFIPKNELIKYRFGLMGYEREKLEDLGLRYNVTRERVRQIIKKVLGEEEYDKDGNLKKPSLDTLRLRKKIIEYCGYNGSK